MKKSKFSASHCAARVLVAGITLYLMVDLLFIPIVLLGSWVMSLENNMETLKSTSSNIRTWQMFGKGLCVPNLCEVLMKGSYAFFVMLAAVCILSLVSSRTKRWLKLERNDCQVEVTTLNTNVRHNRATASNGSLSYRKWILLICIFVVIGVTLLNLQSTCERCLDHQKKFYGTFQAMYKTVQEQMAFAQQRDCGCSWLLLSREIDILRNDVKTMLLLEGALCSSYLLLLVWMQWNRGH